ncbi:hypothetical protein LSAT2_012016 [Lamellibrachia satsuma]|nr:hypothetical protein LSAT2_012016 [Lamellibrachia satsuma]
MTTLSDNDLGKEEMKKCNVTSFSKGSVLVHFQVVVRKSGETTKEQLKDHLLNEMKKGKGKFHQYLKDPSAARLTMESAPEHTTTSPTAKPVVPTSPSAWPTTTTTSLTTHVVSTTSPEGPVTTNTVASSGTITMTSSSVNRSTKRNESTHTTDTPTTTTSTTTTPAPLLCVNVTCLNGGTCDHTRTGFVCHCPYGYTGKKCETKIDCSYNPCKSNYTQRDHTQQYIILL